MYYEKVADYYDQDAADFDKRYMGNRVLQRIRQDFREEVKRLHFSHMLEIGFGTGIDMIHFRKTHPHASIAGIDISPGMHEIAGKNIRQAGLTGITTYVGQPADIGTLFGNKGFDMIYVFFGALNTVADLKQAAESLKQQCIPGGILVLSFVNKYYLAGMLLEILKGKPRRAFARIKPVWGGYSPVKYLPSKCYSPVDIAQCFSGLKLIKRKGYSIIHPAWYFVKLNTVLQAFSGLLWRIDSWLNKTFLWRFGEYTLFVFQKPDESA